MDRGQMLNGDLSRDLALPHAMSQSCAGSQRRLPIRLGWGERPTSGSRELEEQGLAQRRRAEVRDELRDALRDSLDQALRPRSKTAELAALRAEIKDLTAELRANTRPYEGGSRDAERRRAKHEHGAA
jgi:hypothetical protein